MAHLETMKTIADSQWRGTTRDAIKPIRSYYPLVTKHISTPLWIQSNLFFGNPPHMTNFISTPLWMQLNDSPDSSLYLEVYFNSIMDAIKLNVISNYRIKILISTPLWMQLNGKTQPIKPTTSPFQLHYGCN